MELQSRIAEFEQANTRVFGISYDPVPVLAQFAEQHAITYSLLSDEGSAVIRRLGLLNMHLAEQQAANGRTVEPRHLGIPYPGLFLLDEQGVIIDKRFEQMYLARPAPDLILEELVATDDLPRAVSATAEGTGVRVVAWLAASTYRPLQRLHLHVVLEIAPGMHVYGSPVQDGLTPLQIEVAPLEGLLTQPAELPEPHPFRMEGTEEQFVVYEGRVAATIPLQVASNIGEVVVALDVHEQACSATVCYPPETLHLELPIQGLDNLRPEPRV